MSCQSKLKHVASKVAGGAGVAAQASKNAYLKTGKAGKSASQLVKVFGNTPQGKGAIVALAMGVAAAGVVARRKLIGKRPKVVKQPIFRSIMSTDGKLESEFAMDGDIISIGDYRLAVSPTMELTSQGLQAKPNAWSVVNLNDGRDMIKDLPDRRSAIKEGVQALKGLISLRESISKYQKKVDDARTASKQQPKSEKK